MEFEWDEQKRLVNIEKHRLDFRDVVEFFGGPYLSGAARAVGTEERFVAVGIVDGLHVTLVFTKRGDVIRLISMLRARYVGRKRYQEIFTR